MPPEPEDPKVVYHYTTMAAMMNIVRTGSIWATSICYLNDATEGDHYKQLISEHIPPYRSTHVLEDLTIFDAILGPSNQDFIARPFVASFSFDDDSLTQWRSYCPNGNGVAIGFRVDCLQHARIGPDGELNSPKVSFKAVEYLNIYDVQRLEKDIDYAIWLSMSYAYDPEHGADRFPASSYFKYFIERIACSSTTVVDK